MALLKEDGGLDIERINQLPFEEYMKEMGSLTEVQVNEYLSALPLDESKGLTQIKIVNSPIENYGVDAEDVLNNLKENINAK